jgi:hypothetical protein
MDNFPKTEHGFFHLTPEGWIRKDYQPFPGDRLETWAYEMECLAEDAKERACMTRTWIQPELAPQTRESLRIRFGEPMAPTLERNVTLEWFA